MAEITASLVKELREITNLGMMACKKALVEAGGDKEQAIKLLKEQGLAVAAKRSEREANEGAIFISSETHKASMLSVCCETDFVAKNETFSSLVSTLAEKFIEKGEAWIGSDDLNELTTQATTKIGENIRVAQGVVFEVSEGMIGSYLHANKKVGVLVELGCSSKRAGEAKLRDVAKDIAMQIAAMNPLAVSSDEIDEKTKAEQKEVFVKQMAYSGKEATILEKIATGKLNKYFSELCLLDMPFVKDGKLKIKDLLKQVSKDLGEEVSIRRFKRFQIGK